jgi:hypothetical protein
MLTPALGRAAVAEVGGRTPLQPPLPSACPFWLTLGAPKHITQCGSRGEHEGGLGFTSRLTGGELSPSLLLPCSVSLTRGAHVSAPLGGSRSWAALRIRTGPVTGFRFCFSFSFMYRFVYRCVKCISRVLGMQMR